MFYNLKIWGKKEVYFMAKKENVTTIQELIQKLKDSDISAYAVLEGWLINCSDKKYDDFYYQNVSKINGFIWGLYSTKFITDYEKNCLNDYVENTYLSN